MKAYVVWDVDNSVGYQDVVFAGNVKEAKKKGFATDSCSDAEWIGMRAKRLPEIDGMQDYSEKELTYELIKLGWWYVFGDIMVTEDNLDVALKRGIVKKRENNQSGI